LQDFLSLSDKFKGIIKAEQPWNTAQKRSSTKEFELPFITSFFSKAKVP
jgi:hypothetical protein